MSAPTPGPRDVAATTVTEDTAESAAIDPGGDDEPDQLPAGGVPGLAILQAGGTEDGPFAALPIVAAPDAVARDEVNRLNAAALAAFKANRFAEARGLFERIVAIIPASPAARSNLAAVLRRTGRNTEAEAQCRRAIALSPDYVAAHMNLAEVLYERRDIVAALACYDRVARLTPDYASVHNHAGLLLRKIGRFSQAQAAFVRALALTPDDLAIRFNLLMTRRDEAALPEALACCRRLAEQAPERAEVLINLAVVLNLSGQYDEALAAFDRALALNSDSFEARFNLSLLLLLRGDYERGWREYEQRWRMIEVVKPSLAQPEWQGEELNGKTILLHCEQGLGDTIQCLRFVPQVAARGGRIVLRVERNLMRLAASLTDTVIISPPNAHLPHFDVWCPLLSLPRILGTRADTIPTVAPYLRPRGAIVERWARQLSEHAGLKVGLVWSGNAQHINDFRRSIGFARLRPLFDVTGVRWFSLQVGRHAPDIAALPPGSIVDLSPELADFAETAGAIVNLDLVIAVDTAVAHLAGALGKPAWVMLPFVPDWRWMIDRDDSPWYPTLRLYRQRAMGDWDDVVARVAADLGRLVAERAARNGG